MPDCVIDATIVAFANSDLSARKRGNFFDKRLAVIEAVVAGHRRIFFNNKLRKEYETLVKERRNDVIHVFFELLDSNKAVFVKRSTLSRQLSSAANQCRWPSHDRHLLAAAVEGVAAWISVTEVKLANCGPAILRRFHIHVEHVD